MKIARCIEAAKEAFKIQNDIEINENAGLEPRKIFKRLYVTAKGDCVRVTIGYTLENLAGCWSDSMYKVVDPNKLRKVVYEFSGTQMTCNKMPVFNKPWLDDSKKQQEKFFDDFADIISISKAS